MRISANEEFTLENLWGLDLHQSCAGECFIDAVHRCACTAGENGCEWIGAGIFDRGFVHAFDGVGDGNRGDDGVVARSGIEDTVDECLRCARTGGVVDGDVCARIRDMGQCALDGFVSFAGASLDEFGAEECEFVLVAECEVGVFFAVVWACDDDGFDFWSGVEEFDGSLEDGASAEVFVEFGA